MAFERFPLVSCAISLAVSAVALARPAAADPPPPDPTAALAAPVSPARTEPPQPPAAPASLSVLDRFAGSYVAAGYFTPGDRVSAAVLGTSVSGTVAPSFFVYRSDVHQLRLAWQLTFRVATAPAPGVSAADVDDTQLTLSDTLTLASWGGRNRAPPGPAAAFDPTLARGGEFHTWALVGGGALFPTSRDSQSSGRSLATVLLAGLRQRIPVLGSRYGEFPQLTLGLTERWTHDLRSSSAVAGAPPPATDTLRHGADAVIPLVRDLPILRNLEARLGFALVNEVGPQLPLLTSTELDFTVAVRPIPEIVFDFGYTTTQKLPAGGVSYGQIEALHLDLALFPERLVRRLSGADNAAGAR
jgi:hypothetical protein